MTTKANINQTIWKRTCWQHTFNEQIYTAEWNQLYNLILHEGFKSKQQGTITAVGVCPGWPTVWDPREKTTVPETLNTA